MVVKISNLFSIFDPKISLGWPLKWLAVVSVLVYQHSGFWFAASRRSASTFQGVGELFSNVKPIFSNLASPGIMLLPSMLFIFICHNNYWGLCPFMFTSSSHLSFSLTLALPLWLGHMLFSILSQPQFMAAHLVPLGTPVVLMPFMVLIELISTVIRPLTLSVRLTANMIAGHLLLVLLSSQASSSFLVVLPIMLALVMLWLLESAVAVIQAYVFSTLMTLYLGEVNTLSLNKKFYI